MLALALAGAPPESLQNTEQLSRTMIPRGAPHGIGCLTAAQSGSSATAFTDDSAVLPTPIPLVSQLWITNNSTASATYCFSQDPTPTITRRGYFSADGDSYYAAGQGACFTLAPGSWPVMVTPQVFHRTGSSASRTPGARAFTCSNSSRPCAAAAECNGGGSCSTVGTTHTYLFAQHRAGASNDSDACDAR